MAQKPMLRGEVGCACVAKTLGFISDWLLTPDKKPQLGAPIGHVCFENECLLKAAKKKNGKINNLAYAIGPHCRLQLTVSTS